MRVSNYVEFINNKYIISLITNAVIEMPLDFNYPNDFYELDDNAIESLIKNGILTYLSEEEEKFFVQDLLKKIWNLNNNKPAVTIVPSLYCNLACPYCYERDYGVDSQIDIINEKNMKKIIDFLKKKEINSIALYGGEPLLKRNKKILEPLLKYISSKKGSVNVTTNGTEILEYSDFMHQGCISTLQITMDGMKEEHDKYRVSKKGHGSFDTIIKNIDAIINKNVNIRIRMNINKENTESSHQLKKMLTKRYENKSNIHIYFAPIKGEMCDFEYGDDGFLHPLTNQIQSDFQQKTIASLPTGSFCSTTSKAGSFVFAPNGIWNCWHDVGIEDKKILDYSEFNLESSTHSRLPQFSEPCSSCKYLLLCAGDCLVENKGNCDIEHKEKMFKNSFKQILEE